ncbi:hypothetical protein [Teredinibacter turnerae]|uniref:hypothetical protein n=1 Tax=Teredinibacter turnerae TaxID=2426 RepID=UPI000303803A|nr:hypothetical protein [Teredinibacter turnerae]
MLNKESYLDSKARALDKWGAAIDKGFTGFQVSPAATANMTIHCSNTMMEMRRSTELAGAFPSMPQQIKHNFPSTKKRNNSSELPLSLL